MRELKAWDGFDLFALAPDDTGGGLIRATQVLGEDGDHGNISKDFLEKSCY
jgi:hypothetical protein